MKKTLILVVVVMLVAAGLAYGANSVKGSKHDLSSNSTRSVKADNLDEICAFCHTPHGTTSTSSAPLWNRTNTSTQLTDYTSSSLNGTSTHTGDYSAVCLSCHDGNVGDETLINVPNSVSGGVVTFGGLGVATYTGMANLADGTMGLKNDHPIGVALTTSGETGLNSVATALAGGVKLYSNLVECASCHNVHDNSQAPFLRVSNSNSAMCLACHNK